MENVFPPELEHLQLLTYAGGGAQGEVDALRTRAKITKPHGIFCDPNGDIYFTELRGNVVRKIDAATNLLVTVAGTGEGGKANGGSTEPTIDSTSLSSRIEREWISLLQDLDGDNLTEAIGTAITETFTKTKKDKSSLAPPLGEFVMTAQMKHGMLTSFDSHTLGWTKTLDSDNVMPSSSNDSELPSFVKAAKLFDLATNFRYQKPEQLLIEPCTFDMPEYVVGVGPGEFIFSDYGSGLVRRYMGGKVETIGGSRGTGLANGDFSSSARFLMPRGGCVAPNGDLYLADFGNNRVCIFDARTNEVRSIGSGFCSSIDGFAGSGFMPPDNPKGERTTEESTKTNPSFASPYQLILRRDQRSFFLAEWVFIRWISYPDHELRTYAGMESRGHQDGPRLESKFCGIVSLLETPDSRYLLVSEYSNNCVRIIDAKTGMVSTLIGGIGPNSLDSSTMTESGFLDGPIRSALIDNPMCMTWNHHGDLILADSVNHTLRIVHGLCEALHCPQPVPISPISSYLFEASTDSLFTYFPSLHPSVAPQKRNSASYDIQQLHLLDHFRPHDVQTELQSISFFEDLPNHKDLFQGLNNFIPSSSASSTIPHKGSSATSISNGIWPSGYLACPIENPFKQTEWIHPSFAFLLSLHNIHALSSLEVPYQYQMKRFTPIGGLVNLDEVQKETVSDLFTLITGHARILFQSIILTAHSSFAVETPNTNGEPRIHFFSTSSGPSSLFIELWSPLKQQHLYDMLKRRISALLILIWRLQLNIEFSSQLGLEWSILRNRTHATAPDIDFEWIWDLKVVAKTILGNHFAVSSETDSPLMTTDIASPSLIVGTNDEEEPMIKGKREPNGSDSDFVPWSLYMDHFYTRFRVETRELPISSVSPLKESSDSNELENHEISPHVPHSGSNAKVPLEVPAHGGILRVSGFRDDVGHRIASFSNISLSQDPVPFYLSEMADKVGGSFEGIPESTKFSASNALEAHDTDVSSPESLDHLVVISTRKQPQRSSNREVASEDRERSPLYSNSRFDHDLHIAEPPSPLSTLFRFLYHNYVFVLLKPKDLDAHQGVDVDSEISRALPPNLLITCDDVHYIQCHDWVLSMKWKWIASVLASGLEESKSRVISLSSSTTMSTESLLLLIQFLYTHSVSSNYDNIDIEGTCWNLSITSPSRVPIDHFLYQSASTMPSDRYNVLNPVQNPHIALLKDILENGELLGMFQFDPHSEPHESNIPALVDVLPTSQAFAALLNTLRRPFDKNPKTLAEAFSLIKPFSQWASKTQYRWLVSYFITNLSTFSSHPMLLKLLSAAAK